MDSESFMAGFSLAAILASVVAACETEDIVWLFLCLPWVAVFILQLLML